MIYYTPDFENIVTDPIFYIEKLVEESNDVFEDSEIALKLRLHCVEELEVKETSLHHSFVLEQLLFAKSNLTIYDEFTPAIESMLNTADIAIYCHIWIWVKPA